MKCKGICEKYRLNKMAGTSWYELGVRCQMCEIFMSNEGTINGNRIHCKCCNYRVRTKPRNKTGKQKLMENKK